MRFTACFLMALLVSRLALAEVPFWGNKASDPAETAPAALPIGHFVWAPQVAPEGPIVVVVSLEEQLAYAYRNGVRIGYAKVSTGKKGYATPTGVFTTLQKDKDHHSKTYNNAPMPYTQRLTWDGVALHAGGVPDYPSSHGCVHLPSEFARLLFEASPLGMTVVVGNAHSAPVDVAHPAMLAPVDARTGQPVETPKLAVAEESRWEPEKVPHGPVSLLLSGADRRLLVFRNGVEIGRSRIAFQDHGTRLGTHVYTVTGVQADGRPKWTAVGIPGHAGDANAPLDPEQTRRVRIPDEFVLKLSPLLKPGATLLVTDAEILPHHTGSALTVLTDKAPEAAL